MSIGHVEITFKHRKDDDDIESQSCFGRSIPNGDHASLPQYLDFAMTALPSYTQHDKDHKITVRATLEDLCDAAEFISREP